MPRSPAPALPVFQQPSADRPHATRAVAASPLDNSPRMVAQKLQLQSMFGPDGHAGSPARAAGVLQGYFLLGVQKTNDESQFVDGATQQAKEDQVWLTLKPELEKAWKALDGHHFSDAVLEEFRDKFLVIAFRAGKATVEAAAGELERIVVQRAEARVALAERDSPAGVGGTLSKTPDLGEKEKHSNAKYKRTSTNAETQEVTVADESLDSDSYTKGPSRRARDGEAATTPAGVKQAWTQQRIMSSIREWTCEAPLARHLALTVWPLLTDSEAGRKWEVKFREMDRLIAFRDAEAQSRFIEISRKVPKAHVKSLDRRDYTVRARQALRRAIVGGTKHPAEQQGVLFYDALLKADVDAAWQAADATFKLTADYEVAGEGGLGMILTHWRPILFFDWILAEDVLNNATN